MKVVGPTRAQRLRRNQDSSQATLADLSVLCAQISARLRELDAAIARIGQERSALAAIANEITDNASPCARGARSAGLAHPSSDIAWMR